MGAITNEPSMEEILSSIKRIIAEDDGGASQAPKASPRRVASLAMESSLADTDLPDDQVLELTEALPVEIDTIEEAPAAEEPVMTAVQTKPETNPAKAATKPRASAQEEPSMVISDASAQAARDSLVNLSRLLVVPEEGSPSNTLEGLVREMLRPMLKEWLDANLPGMVETMVKREIDRITGRV